jgi:hypothetical protein
MKPLQTTTISIGDKTLEYRFSVRAMMLYSEITNKEASGISGLNDVIMFSYAAYMAANMYNKTPEQIMEIDDYVNLLDDYPDKIKELVSLIYSNNSSKKKQ